jgi:hypothetical protein
MEQGVTEMERTFVISTTRSWLRYEIEELARERKVDEIVREILKRMERAGMPLRWAGIIAAIGGTIYAYKRPIPTPLVYEKCSDEYSEKSISIGIWAGRKAGIFQGGYMSGLIYFTPEFARFLRLPVMEVPPVKPRGAPRRKRKQRTQASAKQ